MLVGAKGYIVTLWCCKKYSRPLGPESPNRGQSAHLQGKNESNGTLTRFLRPPASPLGQRQKEQKGHGKGIRLCFAPADECLRQERAVGAVL